MPTVCFALLASMSTLILLLQSTRCFSKSTFHGAIIKSGVHNLLVDGFELSARKT